MAKRGKYLNKKQVLSLLDNSCKSIIGEIRKKKYPKSTLKKIRKYEKERENRVTIHKAVGRALGEKTKKKKAPTTKADKTIKKLEDLNSKLVNNFTSFQKVMTNMVGKFENLSGQIARLLELFELSAKTFAEEFPAERDQELLNKIESVLKQNKTIAKSITLIEEKTRERLEKHLLQGHGIAPENQEKQKQPGFSSNQSSEQKNQGNNSSQHRGSSQSSSSTKYPPKPSPSSQHSSLNPPQPSSSRPSPPKGYIPQNPGGNEKAK